MFNGTSVITHVIVSIWHQPTSHMISSVQMCSRFIPWWEWGYNHSKSILQTWICINLQFISSFVSFVGIDLLCCRISRLLSWLPCFGPSPSLALPTPWHLSGEPGEVTDLVTNRCVSQEPEALLCRAFLILFTKDVQHPKLFKPKWTPRYSLHWAPRSNPITGFQPPKHFFNGQTISSWFPVSWMFFFFRSDIKTFVLLSHPEWAIQQVLLLPTGGCEPPLPCCHWPFDGLHGPEQGSDGCNNPGCWFMTFWISIMVFQSYEMGRTRTCHTNFPVVKSQGFLFIKTMLN